MRLVVLTTICYESGGPPHLPAAGAFRQLARGHRGQLGMAPDAVAGRPAKGVAERSAPYSATGKGSDHVLVTVGGRIEVPILMCPPGSGSSGAFRDRDLRTGAWPKFHIICLAGAGSAAALAHPGVRGLDCFAPPSTNWSLR
jgi:hypothetical protein